MAEEEKALSVSALNAQIRATLEGNYRGLWVEGELSNVKINASSGHAYFTLKDERAQVGAVMFAGAVRGVSFPLRDGVKVQARGDVSVYEPRGQYQLVVRSLKKVGAGDLMAQFEELKRKLAAEGLFSPARKRTLPRLPRIVGIVTSPTGAAIRDMFNVTRRRCPNLRILLAPCRVQGEGAGKEVAEGIAMFHRLPAEDRPDVLIIGRGGGSAEDLWCFNDETLARTIAASRIPIISAVGHEIDFTISDFVADVRAPTPSAAAELVAGQKDDFLRSLEASRATMERELRHALETAQGRLARIRDHRVFHQPQSLLQQHRQHLDLLDAAMRAALTEKGDEMRRAVERAMPRLQMGANRVLEHARTNLAPHGMRLQNAMGRVLTAKKSRLELLAGRLSALDPTAVLRRGYGIVRGADGKVLRSVAEVAPGDRITAQVSDGTISAVVAGEAPAAPRAPEPIRLPAEEKVAKRGKRRAQPADDRQLTLL